MKLVKLGAAAFLLVVLGCGATVAETDSDRSLAELVARQRAELELQRLEIEDKIFECMADEGFEYQSLAGIYSEWGEHTLLPSEVPLFLDNSEWETKGYGLLSVVLDTARTIGRLEEADVGVSEEYTKALYGVEGESEGCASRGRAEVVDGSIRLAELDETRQSIEDRSIERLSSNPLVIEWEECIMSNGFEVIGIRGPSDYILNEIVNSESENSLVYDPSLLGISYDIELNRFVSGDAAFDTRLSEMYRAEVDLAKADLECSRELYPVAQEIYREESSVALAGFGSE